MCQTYSLYFTIFFIYLTLLFLKCRCNLYNVNDEYDRPLNPDYEGGLKCCYDGTQCKVKMALKVLKESLKYTVKWVDWSDSIILVKIFIFDVTDSQILIFVQHSLTFVLRIWFCSQNILYNSLDLVRKFMKNQKPQSSFGV